MNTNDPNDPNDPNAAGSPGTPPPFERPASPEQPAPGQPGAAGPSASPPGGRSAEERQWAMFAHLSALTGLVTGGLGCIIGPLVIWLVKKDTMPFVDDQGKEALNFNITMGVAVALLMTVGTVLLVILVGFLLYIAAFFVGIFWLVVTIIAAMKANEGVAYRYPLTVRLIK